MRSLLELAGSVSRKHLALAVRGGAGMRRAFLLALAVVAAGALTLGPPARAVAPYCEDFDSGDLSRWNWYSGGQAGWYVTAQDAYSGFNSARAGSVDPGQESTLEITLTRAVGNVSFFRRTAGGNWLKFYVDGAEQGSWSGDTPWGSAAVSFPVTAGRHTYRWVWHQGDTRSDTAWIDAVTFPPQEAGSPQIRVYSETSRLYFSGSAGHRSPLPQTFTVANSAGGALNWSATNTQSWLTLSPRTGVSRGDSTTVTAAVATGTLRPGRYQDTIAISAPGAANTPQQVQVLFDVDRPYDEDWETGTLTHVPSGGSAWRTEGWTVTHPYSWEGEWSATGGNNTWLEVTVTRGAGNVSFHVKNDGDQAGCNGGLYGGYLYFYVDGVLRDSLWREDWSETPRTYSVSAGTHTYRWERGDRVHDWCDGWETSGWLDNIQFPPPLPAASQVAFVQQPTRTVPGGAISPPVAVAVQDASGNTMTGARNPITIAIGNNPSAGVLTGTKTVTPGPDGVARFSDLKIDKAGLGYTLTASAAGLTGDQSARFDIGTPGPPAKIAFRQQPTNAAARAYLTPAVTVEIQDALGNQVSPASGTVVAALARNPGRGTLAGTASVQASHGVATFNDLSINRPGTGYTLLVGAAGLQGVASVPFDIAVGEASQLAFSVQPRAVRTGAAITPAVKVAIQDDCGNTVTTATDAVTLGLFDNPGGGTLGGTTTASAVAGVATFANLTVDKPGAGYTLEATVAGVTGATSGRFNVTQGPAARLSFAQQPTSTTVGIPVTPAVRVAITDAGGNVLTSATSYVTLSLAANPGSATFVNKTVRAVAGIVTFAGVTLNKPGTGYRLRAAATGLTGADSDPFNVASRALSFLQQPTDTQVGVPVNPTVTVQITDAEGDRIVTATDSVTLSLAANPGSATFANKTARAVAGVATFTNVALNKTGTGYKLRAAATGHASAESSPFNVTPRGAARMSFTTQPPRTIRAGAPFTVRVTLLDAAGLPAGAATNRISLSLAPASSAAILSGNTSVVAVAGVATFTGLSVDKTGSGYTLKATADGLPDATSTPFAATAGLPARLVFTTQPQSTAADRALAAVAVSVLDANGNPVTTATNTVTLALQGGAAGAQIAGITRKSSAAGKATFTGLTLRKAGTGYALLATATGLQGATSAAFDISAGAPRNLAFAVQPPPQSAVSTTLAPPIQVAVRDAYGNLVTTATNEVTLSLVVNPGGGTLGGTPTKSAEGGIATFADLTVNKPGAGYKLKAVSGTLATATSNAFSVGLGLPPKLVFLVQPRTTKAGVTMLAVKVGIQDAAGRAMPTATDRVVLSLETNPSRATLSGTTAKNAVAGVATFDDLSINRSGEGYTLYAGSGSFQAARSVAFNILPSYHLVWTQGPPRIAVSGAVLAPPMEVEVRDDSDNLVTTPILIRLALKEGAGQGTVSGHLAKTTEDGAATFDDVKIILPPGGPSLVPVPFTFVATAVGMPPVEGPIVVVLRSQ